MSDFSNDLIDASKSNDGEAFAALAKHLIESLDDRLQTATSLIRIIHESDARRAELAVNALRYTGMALENYCFQELVMAAERIFTPQHLAKLAEIHLLRKKTSKRPFSPEVRLLRSIIQAISVKANPRAKVVVETIKQTLRGTSLEYYIAEL